MWATVATRPDIAFAVALLSRFMEKPEKKHWEAVKRVIKYLKGTKQLRLTYGTSRTGMTAYTDSDWGTQSDRYSISGHTFIIDGGAVVWSSNKQHIIALSSAEAEYIATTHAIKEACWIHSFIGEITRPLRNPITVYCDNQAVISLSKNNCFQARTKHIDIRIKQMFETSKKNIIKLIYCPTDNMVADIFTKPLSRPKFQRFIQDLGLLSTRLEGEC
jgi:hypothetical protein